jgi:ATP-dependent Clp protease adaptor protein ClpS
VIQDMDKIFSQDTYELVDPITGNIDDTTFASKVILFNDEWHSFDDVINQLIKAIKCSIERAEELTFEVHTKGKACVYDGELETCLKVSSVLEEIALHTQIEY